MKINHLFLITILFVTPVLNAQSILGIDVYNGQGNINWIQVANEVTFAYVKATEGRTYTDPRFFTNITNGENAGVIMGAYHFARPDNNTAVQDANNFLNQAQNYIGNGYLPPALDLEDPNSNTHLDQIYTSAQLTNWVLTWLATVESQTGVRPIIYTNSHYANYLGSSVNSYGLWIAKPGTSPTSPPSNLGVWNDWVFKQYSWYGSVSGISGNVDLDVFNGSITDFNNMIGSTYPPVNDECNNAIQLQSNLNCNYTSGTVDGSTPDNSRAPATCDNWSNPLAADVFYKFTAVSSSHTIIVNPTGNLDPVLTLYQGSNCYNLTEIDCADSGGGNGYSETINATGLTVGQTYWIRIYDYGSQPPSNGGFEICITHNDSEDIFLTNPSITSSTTVNPGGTISVQVYQNYSGSSNAVPDVYLYYYLSVDCNLDTSDILLYDDDYSTIDASDHSDRERETLTIPSNMPPGTYYILFVADATNVINEIDEGNNIACVQFTVNNTSGIEDNNENDFRLFPNPTKGIINIDSSKNYDNLSLQIFDLNGRNVYSKSNIKNQIDISSLPSGIYIIKIRDSKDYLTIKKIIKE